MGTLFNFYQKKGKYEITPEITEALAAIAADLMKGSVGGRHWIKIAQNAVDTAEKAPSFQQMFTGSNPLYVPAQSGGRNEVTIAHDAGLLINNNNCLINAIAHAALGRNANITELVTIRRQTRDVGQMMVATPNVIGIIQGALGITRGVTIHYPHPLPQEDFPGVLPPIVIYHTGNQHFQDINPWT
jgi:hypothetical protein